MNNSTNADFPPRELLRVLNGLTPLERRILTNYQSGDFIDCSPVANETDIDTSASWGEDRTLRAKFLEWLLSSNKTVANIGNSGIQISGARIEGTLVLDGITLQKPLKLKKCVAGRLSLVGSEIRDLCLEGCRIIHLDLTDCRIAVDINLDSIQIEAQLNIDSCSVGDSVFCRGAKIGADQGTAISALGIAVGSDFALDGSTVTGTVDLRESSITGLCSLEGVRIHGGENNSSAFYADGINIGTDLQVLNSRIVGDVRLLFSKIGGTLQIENSFIRSCSSPAIHCDGIEVKGDVKIARSRIHGESRFISANLKGDLNLEGSVIRMGRKSDTSIALNLQGSAINGNLFMNDMRKRPSGCIDLTRARISVIHDKESLWPEPAKQHNFSLDGLIYEAFGSDCDISVSTRLRWLKTQSDAAPLYCTPFSKLV